VFTARYALSPYIKQIRFVFKGLIFYTGNTVPTPQLYLDVYYKIRLHVLTACSDPQAILVTVAGHMYIHDLHLT
jgi:hypothetical protein